MSSVFICVFALLFFLCLHFSHPLVRCLLPVDRVKEDEEDEKEFGAIARAHSDVLSARGDKKKPHGRRYGDDTASALNAAAAESAAVGIDEPMTRDQILKMIKVHRG